MKDILGISVSKKSDEFVIHGSDEDYDYHYESKDKHDIIKFISEVFYNVNGDKLKLALVDSQYLLPYVTTKEAKKKDSSVSKMDTSLCVDVDDYLSGALTEQPEQEEEPQQDDEEEDQQPDEEEPQQEEEDQQQQEEEPPPQEERPMGFGMMMMGMPRPGGGYPRPGMPKKQPEPEPEPEEEDQQEEEYQPPPKPKPVPHVAPKPAGPHNFPRPAALRPGGNTNQNPTPAPMNRPAPVMNRPSPAAAPSGGAPTGFAAKLALLQGRMAGGGSGGGGGSSEPEPPRDKPIEIEVAASSNVAKLDMGKMINKLSKEMNKSGGAGDTSKLKAAKAEKITVGKVSIILLI